MISMSVFFNDTYPSVSVMLEPIPAELEWEPELHPVHLRVNTERRKTFHTHIDICVQFRVASWYDLYVKPTVTWDIMQTQMSSHWEC